MTDATPAAIAAAPSAPADLPDRAPRLSSRREFATTLALSALGVSTLGACAHAAAARVAATPVATTTAGVDSAGAATGHHRADPVADALFAAVDARYGGRLEPAEREQVRAAIGRTVRLSDALRNQHVPNGVDPFASFCRGAGAAAATTLSAPAASVGGKGA